MALIEVDQQLLVQLDSIELRIKVLLPREPLATTKRVLIARSVYNRRQISCIIKFIETMKF
jgi:hypothetical protein